MTQSPHIIIVDDEAPAREMVGEYLKMHGFTVTLCDGGKTLRSAIDANVPDLVVLDLNMPEEDGLSIIRDLKGRTNVPVIMLTATASPQDSERDPVSLTYVWTVNGTPVQTHTTTATTDSLGAAVPHRTFPSRAVPHTEFPSESFYLAACSVGVVGACGLT